MLQESSWVLAFQRLLENPQAKNIMVASMLRAGQVPKYDTSMLHSQGELLFLEFCFWFSSNMSSVSGVQINQFRTLQSRVYYTSREQRFPPQREGLITCSD